MAESSYNLEKAGPVGLARVIGLGEHPEPLWQPEDLAAVFRHQMDAPVAVDLASLDPRVSGKVRAIAGGSGLLLKSFRDLFQHAAPPVDLLRLVKDFAKLNRDQPESVLPTDVATVLYCLSIAAALVRRGERISGLTDSELGRGFVWAMGQSWIDEPARDLLSSARGKLSTGQGGATST